MLTAHAQTRLQQRAIPREAVETLLDYGERRRRGGADVYFLSRAARTGREGRSGKMGTNGSLGRSTPTLS